MKNSYFATYYQQGENSVFCYRTAQTVYEEQFYNGSLVSCGWNSAGYPLNVLSGFPSRIERKRFTEPFAFNLEVDGVSLDFGLDFVSFETKQSENGEISVLTLESRVKPVRIRVVTTLDGTAMLTRKIELENLPEGEYTLEVVAENCYGMQSAPLTV